MERLVRLASCLDIWTLGVARNCPQAHRPIRRLRLPPRRHRLLGCAGWYKGRHRLAVPAPLHLRYLGIKGTLAHLESPYQAHNKKTLIRTPTVVLTSASRVATDQSVYCGDLQSISCKISLFGIKSIVHWMTSFQRSREP